MPEPESAAPQGRRAAARLLIAAAALAALAWAARPDGRLHIFFPALPGDAALVQLPDGSFALIDGGSDPAALAVALGRRMPFWRRDLALVVLTGADSGRLPGQLAALRRYRAGRALAAPYALEGGGAQLREWRRLLAEQGAPLAAAAPGERIAVGGATLRVLRATPGRDGGLVIRIDGGGGGAVIAHGLGDADERALAGPQRPAQLLVVPWARDPRTPMAEALRPRAILFSDGQKSDRPALLTYAERAVGGAALYHERLDGWVEWASDGRRAEVYTEAGATPWWEAAWRRLLDAL